MKKILGSMVVIGALFLTGCGSDKVTLNQAITKGMILTKGMTKAQVMKTLGREPDSVQKVGNIELWTYEGIVTNPDDDTLRKYKNLTIRFNNGVVDYTGYFGCKLPKVED
jgi:outer membrane protein assembly factor BamE (lipoprotein component of BamABCDE complex)